MTQMTPSSFFSYPQIQADIDRETYNRRDVHGTGQRTITTQSPSHTDGRTGLEQHIERRVFALDAELAAIQADKVSGEARVLE